MAEVTCIIKDVDAAEGPCWTRDGRTFMVEPYKGWITEILADGSRRDFANTGGIPAGLQIDRNNEIWVADMKLGIFRIETDGTVHHEVSTFNGEPIRGCNDCYFDSQGNLYFTAPAGSDGDNPVGELFCRLVDGTVNRLDGGYAFCNGLAVTADDKTLIVAETFTKQLHAFDIVAPGVVANKRLWATLPGNKFGGPDGIDFDIEGRLLVTHYGSSTIEVYSPQGEWLRALEMPFEKVTNVHFCGPDSTTLIITENSDHGLWTCEYETTGQIQYGWG